MGALPSLRLVIAIAACAAVAYAPAACTSPDPTPATEDPAVAAPRPAEPPAPPAPAPAAPAAPAAPDTRAYPWLGDPSIRAPEPVDTLEQRFAPPPGLARVPVAEGSFGAWLRRLPLAAEGTPVRSYAGGVILPPDHPNLAAVVAIDPGQADLQQCADSIVRLHAEWRWSKGARDHSYRAGAGTEMPLSRWLAGERPGQRGQALVWEPRKPRAEADHATFRAYLDGVFSWANTGSLAVQASPVRREDVAPGDFVVMPGAPGHAVLVLDMVRGDDGRTALLLGQGFMPAQNFQVLRPGGQGAWFFVDPADDALRTPFWRPFPWRLLRRLAD